ncbi:hypothetical protein HK096_008581, partial [Nowakowskiella sp. JEL0078]
MAISGALVFLRMIRVSLIFEALELNPVWLILIKQFTQKIVGGRMLLKTAKFG